MQLGFVMEQILGHVTHTQNLKQAAARLPHVSPTYLDVPFSGDLGVWEKLPVIRSKWSVRASLDAYLKLRPHRNRLDAVLFHTQMTSLFSTSIMRSLPSVVSLDSPPFNRHESYYATLETPRSIAYKNRTYRRVFEATTHLVAWSQWVKNDLVAYYDVPVAKITVIPPGIDTVDWNFPARSASHNRAIHLLFVGGDFARKGGETLLAAFHLLPASLNAHLHIVTKADQPQVALAYGDNITVYTDIAPNSPRLHALFQQADIFVLPTCSDCLPLAVLEALSAGLPVITTNVGALAEAVEDGVNGCIIPINAAPALADAVASLACSPAQLRAQSHAARETALAKFDAAANYGRLLGVLQSIRK